MVASRRHHRSSHSKKHRSRSKSRKLATGRKRLNVKFLILLLIVLGGVGVGIVGVLYRQHRHNPDIYVKRADALMAEEKYAQAVRQYEKAIYYDETDAETLMKMAEALLNVDPESSSKAAKNTMRTIGILSRVTSLDVKNKDAQAKLLKMLHEHAEQLSHPTLFEQLLAHADRFLQEDADNKLALKYKALAEGELMKRDALGEQDALRARDDIEAALKNEPDNPQLVRYLSIWYSAQARRASAGQILADPTDLQTKAQDILTDYLARHPEDLEARMLLAQTYAMHEKKDRALEIMLAVEDSLLRGHHAELVPQAATFLMSLDQTPAATVDGTITTDGLLRAEQLLRQAREKNQDDMEINVHLALILKKLEKAEESTELLAHSFATDEKKGAGTSAVTTKNLRMVAGMNLANTYLSRAEKAEDPAERTALLKKAEETAAKLRQEVSGTAVTDLLEGKIQMLQGNLTAAIQKFEAADTKFNGTNPEPIFLSAIVLKRRGESGAAAERLERLAAGIKGPKGLRVLRELATIYFQVNNTSKADRTVDRMLEVASDNEEALILKSEVLLRKHKEALEEDKKTVARQYLQESFGILQPMAASGSLKAKLQLSRVYQANDEIDKAREILVESWKKERDNLKLLQHLIRLDIQAGAKETARERVASVRQEHPDSKALKLLQERLEDKGDVLTSLEEMLADNEDSFASSMNLYALYRKTGQEEKAKAALGKASVMRPDDETILAEQFNEALQSAQWETAETLARKAASLNLDGARGLFWLGRLEMARSKFSRAVGTLQLAVKQRPLYSDGWRLLGDAQRLTGDLVEAEKAYQEALKMKPDNINALINLFATHDARGLYQVALGDLERAVELAPTNKQIRNMHLEYLARDNPRIALERRLRIKDANPDDAENQRDIARLYAKIGNDKAALALAEELLQQAPNDFRNVAATADIMKTAGKFAKGHQLLNDFIATHPEDVNAQHWITLARYRLAGNLSPGAIEAYEQAIVLEDPVNKEASRELADWYFNNQFFSQALPLYRSAFAQSKDPRLWLRYIDTLTYAEELNQAQKLLNEYVGVHGHSTQSSLLECLIALRNEEYQRAERAADRAIDLDSDNPQAYLHRARVKIQAGGKDGVRRAVMDLQKALSFDPKLLPAREMLVELYLTPQENNVPAAIDQLLSILQQNARHVPARRRLSQLYLQNKNEVKLADFLEESIQLMPEVADWYKLRGQLALQEEKPEKAVTDLRKAFSLEKTPDSLAVLCQALSKAGKPEEAMSFLSEWSEQVNQNPVLMALRAGLLHATDQKLEAQQDLTAALKMVGTNQQGIQMVVQQAKNILELRAAGELLKEQARTDSTGLLALFTGQLLLEADLTRDAMACLEAARIQVGNNGPLKSRVMHLLAHTNQELEDYRAAATIYEQLLQQNNSDFIALNNLAFLFSEHLNDPQKGLEYAEKAIQLVPDDPASEGNVLDTLGWAQFKSGKIDEAKMTLQRSIRQAPDSLHNRYHMAEVLMARDQANEAELQLRMLIRMAHERGDKEMLQKALVLHQRTQ